MCTPMLTYNTVKKMFLDHSYQFREDRMALNVGAIRTKQSKSDKFDDFGFAAFVNQIGEPHLFTFACTTDPGKHYLQNPMNKNGCIIIVPGQYIEVFGKGLHNGNYECFKQYGEFLYVRDYNKDSTLDFNLYRNLDNLKVRGFWGVNGTNLHRASMFKSLLNIGFYSAGCIVVQSPLKFKQLIELRDATIPYGYSKWDFTLFEEGFNVNYQQKLA